MIRGTTPTLTFTLPFNVSELSEYYISIGQLNGLAIDGVIEKDQDDCTSSGKVITCVLSQADTLKLHADYPVRIQLRAKTSGGVAMASKMINTTVGAIIKEGVI